MTGSGAGMACQAAEGPAYREPAGATNPAARLYELLQSENDIFHSALFEAATLLVDAPRLPPVLRTVVVRELGEVVRSISYQPLQEEAIRHLGRIGGPVVRTLLGSLATTRRLGLPIRHCALVELRRGGRDEMLAKSLAHNEDIAQDPLLAVETAALLADHHLTAQAEELLLRVARVRIFTTEARDRLAECSETMSLPGLHLGLLEMVRDPTFSRDLHSSVVRLLFVTRPAPSAVDVFKLFDDRRIDAVIRRDLAEAVGQIGDPMLPQTLITLIRHPTIHAGVRARLALTLGSIHQARVADEIVTLIEDHGLDAGLRCRLASALGHLKAGHLTARLLAMIRDTTLELPIRRSLARTIASLKGAAVTDQIRGLLNEETLDIGVQARLAHSLARLGDDEGAVAAMSRLVQTRSFSSLIRSRMVRELCQIPHPEVPTILRGLLEDTPTSGPLRREIIVGLVRTGDTDAADELVRYVRQRALTIDIRRDMIEAITHLGGRARPILLELLTDQHLDGKLRQTIADRLAPLCGPSEIAHIIAIVEDPRQDLAVRVDAGRVLGTVANTLDAVRALTKLLGEVSNRHGPTYAALLSICRRMGLKVFPKAVGWTPVRYLP